MPTRPLQWTWYSLTLGKMIGKATDAPVESTLAEAIKLHRDGAFAKAERLYQQVLKSSPAHHICNYNLAVLYSQTGRNDVALGHYKSAAEQEPSRQLYWLSYGRALASSAKIDEAITYLRQVVRAHPHEAEPYHLLANLLRSRGLLDEALQCCRRAVAITPNHPLAHYSLATTLRLKGILAEARASLQKSIALYPDFAEAHNDLGMILLQEGMPDLAEQSFRRATELDPKNAPAFNYLGLSLRLLKRFEESLKAHRIALELDANSAEGHNNLGICLYDMGNFQEAELVYRKAFAIKPDYAEAFNNLGNALMRQGSMRFAEAVGAYRRAIDIAPDYLEAYDHLGTAYCELHQIREAFEWFTRAAARRFHCPNPGEEQAHHKRLHDDEQRAYILRAESREITIDGPLRIVHASAVTGPVINPKNNRDAIEAQWRQNRPQIVVIDDFLTQPAMEQLRLFCLGSTIWRETFNDGYLGARPESGFSAPLLAQIAEELRITYPNIFRQHPLLYCWSFKYDSKLKGTKIHADFAAVNVNFWITPDEANLQARGGGLKIWDVAAPLDWDFEVYNRDERKIRDFLSRNNARANKVAYRANRAVIFDSDLFHETDDMSFREGYENRRINITLLYGRRRNSEDEI